MAQATGTRRRGRSPPPPAAAAPWEGQAVPLSAAAHPRGWKLYYAGCSSGDPYYYNHDTGESTWAASHRRLDHLKMDPATDLRQMHQVNERAPAGPTGSASLSSASPLSSIGRDRSSSSSDENSSEESSDPEESGGGSGSGSGTESPQHSHRSSSSMLSSSEEASDELSSDEESHFRLLLKSSAGQRALTEEVKDIAQRVDRQAERERRRAWRRRMTREPRASFALVMRDEEAQVYVGSDEDSSSESSEIVLAFDESIDDEVLGDDAFVKRVDRALALARAGPTAAVWVVQKLVCLLGSLIRRSFSAR